MPSVFQPYGYSEKKEVSMVVKIRFRHGPVVSRRKGKNGRAALLLASVLTLTSVCIGSLGLWRLAEDLDLAGEFFFHDGLLSHWQVWIAGASVTQFIGWKLTRHARSAEQEPDAALALEPEPPKRAAASV